MEISDLQRAQIADLARKYRLALVVLFGSQARGDANKQSDIDIGIVAKNELRPLEVGTVAAALSRIMMAEVEVAQISQMSPLYQRSVIEDGVLLYEYEPGRFDRFAVYVYDLYWESKRLLALRRHYLQSL